MTIRSRITARLTAIEDGFDLYFAPWAGDVQRAAAHRAEIERIQAEAGDPPRTQIDPHQVEPGEIAADEATAEAEAADRIDAARSAYEEALADRTPQEAAGDPAVQAAADAVAEVVGNSTTEEVAAWDRRDRERRTAEEERAQPSGPGRS